MTIHELIQQLQTYKNSDVEPVIVLANGREYKIEVEFTDQKVKLHARNNE